MEPIDYSKCTMEDLMEIRKGVIEELKNRVETEDVDELKRVRDELASQISKMQFYRTRNTI